MPEANVRVKAVHSPCKGICRQHPKESLCIGCYRTNHEKYDWKTMTNEQKLETLALCELRKRKLGPLSEEGSYYIHPLDC